MLKRYSRNTCMNNQCYDNNSCNKEKNIIEEKCQNNCQCSYMQNDYVDSCECGFDDENNVFPENPMFGQSYVPIQYMGKTFRPQQDQQ